MPKLPDPDRLFTETRWVWRLARSLVKDDPTADDVVQQTWIAALQHPPRMVEDAQSLRAWLATVVRNLATRARRSDSRRQAREQFAAQPEAVGSVDRIVESESVRREIVAAVLVLSEPYRSTVVLRYFDELSSAEIARRLDLPESTVRNRLKRGLAELRTRLTREHGPNWREHCLFVIPTGHVAAGHAVGLGTLAAGVFASGASVFALIALIVALLAGLWLWSGHKTGAREDSQLLVGRLDPRRSPADLASNGTTASSIAPSTERMAATTESEASKITAELGMIGFGHVQGRDGHTVKRGDVSWIDRTGEERTATIDARGWYSVNNLREGPWRVFADWTGYRPIERLVEPTREGVLRCDLELDPFERVAIKFQNPAGESLLKLTAPGQSNNFTHLSVVATRTLPAARLEMVDQNAPDEYGIGRYYALNSFGAMGEWMVPDGCAGSLELREPLPAYASLVLRDVVIETRLLPAGTSEITFTIPDDVLTSRLVHARVRAVDLAGKPLVGVYAALEPSYTHGFETLTDTSGVADIKNASPGVVILRMYGQGLEPFEQIVDAAPGADLDLGTVRLGPSAHVRGRVVDAHGSPVATTLKWARLDLLERVEGFRMRSEVRSDATGSFVIETAPRTKLFLTTDSSVRDRASAGVQVDTSSGDANDVVVVLETSVHVVFDFKPRDDRRSRWLLRSVAGTPIAADEIEARRPVRVDLLPGAYVLEIITADGVVQRQSIDARARAGMVEVAW